MPRKGVAAPRAGTAGSVGRRPGRLAVGVVGVGRVGAVLGAALNRAGHLVVAAAAVSTASRARAGAALPGVPLLPVADVVSQAQLVLLTVPDDALPGLVAGLAATEAFQPGSLVVHVSGRYGLEVLDPATRLGALPLALHPVMTFTGSSMDLDRLAGASFGVTAPDVLLPVAQALVIEMGGEPVVVPAQLRPLYHAALATGANHLVTLVTEAVSLLAAAGVEHPARVIAPLLSAALDNALRCGDAALTGPVARGDAGTVGAHLRALAAHAPESVPAYVAMARLTADRALAAGRLEPAAAATLLEVLADPVEGETR